MRLLTQISDHSFVNCLEQTRDSYQIVGLPKLQRQAVNRWTDKTNRTGNSYESHRDNEQSEASSIMSLAQSSIMDRLTRRLDAYYSMFTL